MGHLCIKVTIYLRGINLGQVNDMYVSRAHSSIFCHQSETLKQATTTPRLVSETGTQSLPKPLYLSLKTPVFYS